MADPYRAAALAHAKLNLSLEIEGVRPDGMHLLDSVVCSISLADRVQMTVRKDEDVTLEVDGEGAGPDTLNLALKAALLFHEAHGGPGFDIKLGKEIPAGGGMGGGSADAAAVLHLANRLSGVDASLAELAVLGGELGADVPFCVIGGLARMRGVGDVVEPIEMPSDLAGACIVVATPPIWMPTAEVYAEWDRAPRRGTADPVPAVLAGLMPTYANDLEPPAEGLVPEMRKLRRTFTKALGAPARMTGSGSTLYGFARSASHATDVAKTIQPYFGVVLVCRPVLQGVDIVG